MAELNSSISLRLPNIPDTVDEVKFEELQLIYNAINQLHLGVDNFLDIPPSIKNAPHTLDITDRGRSVDTDSDITIPLESASNFSYGNTVAITNVSATTISIFAAVGVTLITAGTTITGDKQLRNFGVVSLRYLGADTWIILGAGLI